MDPNIPYPYDKNQGYKYMPKPDNQRNIPPHKIAHQGQHSDFSISPNPIYQQMQYQVPAVPHFQPPFYNENPNISYHMQMQAQHQRTTMETKSFIKTMEFQKEQEISKQYAMKLEMLKLSMQANIPGDLIPQLFHNDKQHAENGNFVPEQNRVSYQDHRIRELPHPNSDVVYIDPSKSIKLRTFSDENGSEDFEKTPESLNDDYNQTENYSNAAQLHFKHQSKRNNSPFKIGEAGVKALDSKSVNMNEAQERNHSRMPSMDGKDTMKFQPKMHPFSTDSHRGHSRSNSSAMNFRDTSARHSPQEQQSKPFTKSHKRYNSMPSALKPSPEISPYKSIPKHTRTRSVFFGSQVDNQTSEALLELSQNNAFTKPIHSRKRSYDFGGPQAPSIDLNIVQRQKRMFSESLKNHDDLEYTVNSKFQFGNTNNDLENTPQHETTIEEEDKDEDTAVKKVQFSDDLLGDEEDNVLNEKRENTLQSILN